MSEGDARVRGLPAIPPGGETAELSPIAVSAEANHGDNAESEKKPVSAGRRVWVIARVCFSVFLLAFVVLICWPPQWGGPVTFAIVSGTSMEPKYHTGDVVFALKSFDGYKVGDSIVYTVHDGDLRGRVVHRIVRELPDGNFLTQGDNKPYTDPWEVQPDWIAGKARFLIPQGAKALLIMRSPIFLAVVAGLLVAAALWPRKGSEAKGDDDDGKPDELDKGADEERKSGPNPPETALDPASASGAPPPNTS